MAAGSVSAVQSSSNADVQKAQRSPEAKEKKVEKKSERLEKLQAKRERKQDSDQAAVVKLSQQSGNQQKADEVKTEQVQKQPESTPVPVAKKAEPVKPKTDGKILNIAVQGTRNGTETKIFNSGESLKPNKVEEPKKKEEEPKASVNVQA